MSEKRAQRPITTDYIPLGEGYGCSLALWDNSLRVSKRKKEAGEWKQTQVIDISARVMTELFIRFPRYFQLMRQKKLEKK